MQYKLYIGSIFSEPTSFDSAEIHRFIIRCMKENRALTFYKKNFIPPQNVASGACILPRSYSFPFYVYGRCVTVPTASWFLKRELISFLLRHYCRSGFTDNENVAIAIVTKTLLMRHCAKASMVEEEFAGIFAVILTIFAIIIFCLIL